MMEKKITSIDIYARCLLRLELIHEKRNIAVDYKCNAYQYLQVCQLSLHAPETICCDYSDKILVNYLNDIKMINVIKIGTEKSFNFQLYYRRFYYLIINLRLQELNFFYSVSTKSFNNNNIHISDCSTEKYVF